MVGIQIQAQLVVALGINTGDRQQAIYKGVFVAELRLQAGKAQPLVGPQIMPRQRFGVGRQQIDFMA